MKSLLGYLWFRITTSNGALVTANTLPIVMAGTILECSSSVVGTYITMSVNYDRCWVESLDGHTYRVYTKTVKKVSYEKNPELFI